MINRLRLFCMILLSLFIHTVLQSYADFRTAYANDIPDVFLYCSQSTDISYFLLVEKSSQQIFLYSFDGTTYNQIEVMPCSTGKVAGAKEEAGDKKTPEGVYFFTTEHLAKDLAPIYGTRAFPMDFPNMLDEANNIGGRAIWLHGSDKELKPMDSNGCIVLENNNMEKLKKYISLKKTPIIIVDKIFYRPADSYKEKAESVIALVNRWKNAFSDGTYHDYLACYNNSFLPEIMWWKDWQKIQNIIKESDYSTEIEHIVILKHKKDVYVATFDEYIIYGEERKKKYIGTNKIFVKFNSDNYPEFIGEEPLALADNVSYVAKGNPILTAFNELVYDIENKKTEQKILATVEGWLDAWSSKNIETYGNYYSDNFIFGDMNITAWLNYKKRLNSKYEYIKVSGENFDIKCKNNKCIVSFVQYYESDKYKIKGNKSIWLIRKNNKWKIYRESYKKL